MPNGATAPAGGYNANIFRAVAEMANIDILPIGKRACDRYGRGYISAENFSRMDAAELARKLCAEFAAGGFDRLGILYTRYISMKSRKVCMKPACCLSPMSRRFWILSCRIMWQDASSVQFAKALPAK